MRLNAPKKIVWRISLFLTVLGVVANFISIPVISGIACWLVLAGYVLLLLGTVLKGF